MAFLSTLALAVALLVVAPYLAHRLRRWRAEDQPFPPAHLLTPRPENARQKSRLEDRALLATRTLLILGLALLGATPLIRCSRLSVQRSGGASVAMAIVVDDSMSMRAALPGKKGTSRFDRAREGARQLVASARDGDAVAVILAGSPARIALAATTDLGAARDVLQTLAPSDRGTDLQGAMVLARSVIATLPQVDRRVVVLSDLADGRAGDAPLGDRAGERGGASLWVPLPELQGDAADCAVLRADRTGLRVRVAVACGPDKSAVGRDVIVEDAQGKALGHASITAPRARGSEADVTVLLPSENENPVRARLAGADAIASDDVAPVVPEAPRGAIAVIADTTEAAVAPGGTPIVEQALSSLKLDIDLQPLPAVPDRPEDLAGTLGVLLDDPPGLTPEQRHALATFLEGGGVALIALGPHSAAAPLGASFAPILSRAISWTEQSESAGADVASAQGPLSGAGQGLDALGARHRATLAPEDASALDPLLKWADGTPLVARRAIGRGQAWVVTLPLSADASDLPLRPGFLSLLDAWARVAQERATPRRSEVGTIWRFRGARVVEVKGPGDPVASYDEGTPRISPALLGIYRLTIDGHVEMRVVAPSERELDLRPRVSAPSSSDGRPGGAARASVDVSEPVALALLVLMALELVLRVRARRRASGSSPG